MFPPDHPYNRDISHEPLDPNSDTYITKLKQRAPVIRPPRPPGDQYFNIVPAAQPFVAVGVAGGTQSFDGTGGYVYQLGPTGSAPIPDGVRYQNQVPGALGDHHLMVIQEGTCRLFEMYAWNPSSARQGWSQLVIWDLANNEQLPDGHGSTTAAGTALLPGIVWKHEVVAGEIKHALDLVLASSANAKFTHVAPAARSAGACGNNYPLDGFPYGGRVRLKASFDPVARGITGTQAQIVIRALQTYGWINTDDSGYPQDSDFRFGDGAVWDAADIAQLGRLKWDDFEVPQMTIITSMACK